MNKMLLISEVAALARDVEKRSWVREARRQKSNGDELLFEKKPNLSAENLTSLIQAAGEDDEAGTTVGLPSSRSIESRLGTFEKIVDDNDGGPLNASQKIKIAELLGQWEEPPRGTQSNKVSRFSNEYISA